MKWQINEYFNLPFCLICQTCRWYLLALSQKAHAVLRAPRGTKYFTEQMLSDLYSANSSTEIPPSQRQALVSSMTPLEVLTMVLHLIIKYCLSPTFSQMKKTINHSNFQAISQHSIYTRWYTALNKIVTRSSNLFSSYTIHRRKTCMHYGFCTSYYSYAMQVM